MSDAEIDSSNLPSARLDSSLEAAGAEFLVLGHLLIEGIQAFKAYTNFPGYDIIATGPVKNTSCRIQVKSRWATDFNRFFLINNFDFDYVVLVALNRGYRGTRTKAKAKAADQGRRAPEFYVFPVDVAQAARDLKGNWGRVQLSRIADLDTYRDGWHRIKAFLEGPDEPSIDL